MKYVYMLRAGESHYKVGITTNILERIKALQTGNGNTIELVTLAPSEDAGKVEKDLHKWLSDNKIPGGREWFDLTPFAAIELVMKINALSLPEYGNYLTLRNLLYRQTLIEKHMDSLSSKVDNALETIPEVVKLRKADNQMIERANRRADVDELFDEATELVKRSGFASASYLQRRLHIGYARAARLIDQLELNEVVGPPDGALRREVLV